MQVIHWCLVEICVWTPAFIMVSLPEGALNLTVVPLGPACCPAPNPDPNPELPNPPPAPVLKEVLAGAGWPKRPVDVFVGWAPNKPVAGAVVAVAPNVGLNADPKPPKADVVWVLVAPKRPPVEAVCAGAPNRPPVG